LGDRITYVGKLGRTLIHRILADVQGSPVAPVIVTIDTPAAMLGKRCDCTAPYVPTLLQ
jgi:hypothetical protein